MFNIKVPGESRRRPKEIQEVWGQPYEHRNMSGSRQGSRCLGRKQTQWASQRDCVPLDIASRRWCDVWVSLSLETRSSGKVGGFLVQNISKHPTVSNKEWQTWGEHLEKQLWRRLHRCALNIYEDLQPSHITGWSLHARSGLPPCAGQAVGCLGSWCWHRVEPPKKDISMGRRMIIRNDPSNFW